MKYLSNYIEDAQTKLFDDMGAFFAFSTKQFDEAKQDGVEYVSMSSGMICPKDNAAALGAGLHEIVKKGIAQDLAENGKKGVIHRELGNHEYSYTGDITDTQESLEGYEITAEEIQAEADEYLEKHYAWEDEQEAKAEAAAAEEVTA